MDIDSTPGPIPNSYWLMDRQLLAGEYPGSSYPDLARTKLEAILNAGIRSFIDLTELRDGLRPYENLLEELTLARRIDVHYRRIGVRDMGLPTSEVMHDILSRIDSEIAAGRPVYLHCWGGIGRTGTVAGCWLVEQGMACDAALERITTLRAPTPEGWKNSPETRDQRSFVRAWTRGERP